MRAADGMRVPTAARRLISVSEMTVRRPFLVCASIASLGLLGAFVGSMRPARVAAAVPLPDRELPAPAGPARRAGQARVAYFAGLMALDSAGRRLERAAEQGTADSVVTAFRAARIAFKAVEALAEYWSPGTVKDLNGPAIDRADTEAPYAMLQTTGMQVMEEVLFPDTTAGWRQVISEQAPIVRWAAARMRQVASGTEPIDGHVFAAARLEVMRVVTLGLAGFDAGSSGDGALEAAVALRGVRAMLEPYMPDLARAERRIADRLDVSLDAAAAYLDAHRDMDGLNRMAFIVAYAGPAARAIDAARRTLGVTLPPSASVWASSAATLFDDDAFDPQAFAPADAPAASPEIIALGRDLFFDVRLSGDASRACASCHQPARAFTDGLARRPNRDGRTPAGARNTPTVINVALQPRTFFDQRTLYLEDQVADVVSNVEEMGSSLTAAASLLGRDPRLAARFDSALGGSGTPVVTPRRIQVVLAAYLRSLQANDSRFDRALRGDTLALSAAERRGFTVFEGKGKCGTCHFLPLFNGATPPLFTESEAEVIGVPSRPLTHNAALDPDPGQFAVTRVPTERHAFKTPTLRNIALTAPYMHNGVYRTLDAVVDFYNRGGGTGIGARLPNQTLPPDPLNLTRREQRDLVAFLRALTDTTTVRAVAPRAARPRPSH